MTRSVARSLCNSWASCCRQLTKADRYTVNSIVIRNIFFQLFRLKRRRKKSSRRRGSESLVESGLEPRGGVTGPRLVRGPEVGASGTLARMSLSAKELRGNRTRRKLSRTDVLVWVLSVYDCNVLSTCGNSADAGSTFRASSSSTSPGSESSCTTAQSQSLWFQVNTNWVTRMYNYRATCYMDKV